MFEAESNPFFAFAEEPKSFFLFDDKTTETPPRKRFMFNFIQFASTINSFSSLPKRFNLRPWRRKTSRALTLQFPLLVADSIMPKEPHRANNLISNVGGRKPKEFKHAFHVWDSVPRGCEFVFIKLALEPPKISFSWLNLSQWLNLSMSIARYGESNSHAYRFSIILFEVRGSPFPSSANVCNSALRLNCISTAPDVLIKFPLNSLCVSRCKEVELGKALTKASGKLQATSVNKTKSEVQPKRRKKSENWILEGNADNNSACGSLMRWIESTCSTSIMTQNGNSSSSGNTPPSIATGNVEERLMVCKRSRMQISLAAILCRWNLPTLLLVRNVRSLIVQHFSSIFGRRRRRDRAEKCNQIKEALCWWLFKPPP